MPNDCPDDYTRYNILPNVVYRRSIAKQNVAQLSTKRQIVFGCVIGPKRTYYFQIFFYFRFFEKILLVSKTSFFCKNLSLSSTVKRQSSLVFIPNYRSFEHKKLLLKV
jgi:hypothetical protein